jgi:RNA polymerase sigma-70 factor, ECF subfamily
MREADQVARWEPAFAEFAAVRYASLLRFALAVCGDRDQAEDLVQTALVRTALRWTSVRRRDDPEAYVRRVIVRQQINAWRRLWSRERPVAQVADRPSPDAAGGVDERDRLWAALMTLPVRQRAVVVLRYLYDQSERQTAEQLQCSVGSVKSQCARGLARLRSVLADEPALVPKEPKDAN